jgi:membrane-associated phospholipid phosphatase
MYLGRHTLAQSLAGACLGCAIFMGLFALRDIVW